MDVLGEAHLAENGYFNIFVFREEDYDYFHAHDFYEIKYIVSGTGFHEALHGKREKIGPGNVIFIDKGVPHSIMSDKASAPIENINILFSDAFIFSGDNAAFGTEFINEMKKMGSVTVYDDMLRFQRIINDMNVEYNQKKEGYLNLLALYARELIFLMLRANREKRHPEKNRYIRQALAYIDENTDKEVSVEKLAQIVHLSANYLSMLFKKEMGMPPIEYIQRVKIQKVCEMLTTTDMTFSDCAYAVGYRNEGYLRRVFKEVTGQTPKEFKKRARS